ncbi:MAG: TetR/AcrR family transcriptional regulator [Myxococcales bacterium]
MSRPQRQAAQHERVVAAITALIGSERGLNVANVVELAGIGRNTFYEYFDDIEHALVSITARALRDFSARAEVALQSARTPLERLRALARAWTEHLFALPAIAQVALRAQPEAAEPTQVSLLAQHVMKVLGDEVEARGALPGLNEPLRVLVVAASFDAVSRSHFAVRPLSAEEMQRVLSDLSQRLLR